MSGSTRDKLIFAALDLFAQKGYDATSVDEIAGAIGIKGPNVYKYFKGKEGILDAIYNYNPKEYYLNGMDIKPDGVKEINSGAELVEYSMNQIEFTMNSEFVKKVRRMYTIEQYHIKRMADEATFHQYTKLMETFTGIFTRMMDNGIIKKCDPEVLALEYLAPVSMLIQITDRDPDKKDEVKEMIKRFLTHFVDTYFLK